MNLNLNDIWKQEASSFFTLNIIVNNGNEDCYVDYAHFNEAGILDCYGFDFNYFNNSSQNIFSSLLSERTEISDKSVMTKMYKFHDFGDNPIVFLVTSEKIYFMKNGIRQTNPFVWEAVDSMKPILELLKERNLKL